MLLFKWHFVLVSAYQEFKINHYIDKVLVLYAKLVLPLSKNHLNLTLTALMSFLSDDYAIFRDTKELNLKSS